ncbi:MAG TPA: leucyl/phenylalanyl-tRNA--protein transferase, partial [Alphaproteobacteria bacterium]|nr:leucyl/phenylalanyl-tRNA--protein transferase [Alphaproteobacteria bacterium]
DILLRTYAAGIFPMAESADDPTLFWVDPDRRGVLPLDTFHVSRKLQKTLRSEKFEVRLDTAFTDVITSCGEAHEGRPSTWINGEIIRLYAGLHRMGHAHSIETWRDGRLVGGLYGVALGGAFFGESMFSREPDASKVALCHLVARLRRGGFKLLDTQFVTKHLSQFGVREISRAEFRRLLAHALDISAEFDRGPLDESDLTFRRSNH